MAGWEEQPVPMVAIVFTQAYKLDQGVQIRVSKRMREKKTGLLFGLNLKAKSSIVSTAVELCIPAKEPVFTEVPPVYSS